MAKVIKPNALFEGSVIGVAAPSSPFSEARFWSGVEVLKSLNFDVKFNDRIFEKDGYLAGSDGERAKELNQLFKDPGIDAIMFARGGYGIQRIMPLLDFSGLKKRPKAVVGGSDLTALLSYLSTHLRISCFYGPMVTRLADKDGETLSSLRDALTLRRLLDASLAGVKVIKGGEARGRFVGGCLSIVTSSIGTYYELDTDGSILFLEDVNEPVYKYDRMLTQLMNAKFFRKVKGVVFGSLGLLKDEETESLFKMMREKFQDFDGPVVAGFKAGHVLPSLTLPLGLKCSLSTSKEMLVFEEKALV